MKKFQYHDWLHLLGVIVPTGLLILIALFYRITPSSDGLAYLAWYDNLSLSNKRVCYGFETIFCGTSLLLKAFRFPPEYYLPFWMALIYVVNYLALRKIAPKGLGQWIFFPIFLVLAWFVYLQPSITQHLVRQYVAVSFLVAGLMSQSMRWRIGHVIIASLFHGFAWLFLPLVVAYRYNKGYTLVVAIALLPFYLDGRDGLWLLLRDFFDFINVLGEAWDNEYLKSLNYKFDLYSQVKYSKQIYPQSSLRGSLVVLLVFLAIPAGLLRLSSETKRQLIGVAIYTLSLYMLFIFNELIAHRIYHYFRQLMIIPTSYAAYSLVTLAPQWGRKLYKQLVASAKPDKTINHGN